VLRLPARGTMFLQVFALLIFGLTASSLAAQQVAVSQPLDSGTVVRLGWREGPKQVGRVLATLTPESDTVVYCRYPAPPCAPGWASTPEVRPVRDMLSVEVQRGSRAGRGAILGAAAGFTIIGLGRWAFADADSPAPFTGQRVSGAAAFVALAAGIGALIGRGAARWVTLP
jgi:hypothetical protein